MAYFIDEAAVLVMVTEIRNKITVIFGDNFSG